MTEWVKTLRKPAYEVVTERATNFPVENFHTLDFFTFSTPIGIADKKNKKKLKIPSRKWKYLSSDARLTAYKMGKYRLVFFFVIFIYYSVNYKSSGRHLGTHSLTLFHSLTDSLTHLLTHPLTHLLTHSFRRKVQPLAIDRCCVLQRVETSTTARDNSQPLPWIYSECRINSIVYKETRY